MRQWVVVGGFLLIVLVVIAGCTAPQSSAANGSKSQNAGTGSIATNAPTPDFSSRSSKLCQSTDIHRFKIFFPDIDGYQRRYKDDYYLRTIGNSIEEEYSGSKFHVDLGIDDFSSCDDNPDNLLKKLKVGDTDNNYTISSHESFDYNGYPATRIGITYFGYLTDAFQEINVNPKILLRLHISGLPGTSKSEFDAEIEKFVNVMDLKGIATVGIAANTITKPISLNAQYNPDGTITVTNNGGPGTADLTIITISVNKGSARNKLDPLAGSVVTVQGVPGSKNRIIALGTFRNGTHQIILDTYVGPNP
jgi:hypothetical protein